MNVIKSSFALIITLLIGSAALQAQYPSSEFESQWQLKWSDPTFVDSFIGSYPPLEDSEPKITKEEVEVFREVIELIKTSPSAAAQRLESEVNENSSAAMIFVLANLYLQSQDTDKAKQYYQQAIKKYPSYRRAHKNLALVLLQDQELEQAQDHIHEAIELGEKDGRLYGLLGYIYLNRGDYLAAESAYTEAILQQPKVKDWKLGLARSLLGMEKYAESSAIFQSLIEEDPNNAQYWLLQVNTYLGLGQPSRAVANLEILRRMGKAKPTSIKLLGDIYMNMKMYDLAISTYGELIETDSAGQYFEPAMRIGQMLVQLQEYERAQAMLEVIESSYSGIDKEQQLSVKVLQAKVVRTQGKIDEAIATLEEIITMDALNGDALLELASIYQKKDQIEEAVFNYEMAAKIEGYEATALVEHARMLVAQKRYAEAVPLLKESLNYKDDPRIVTFLDKVERAARNAS